MEGILQQILYESSSSVNKTPPMTAVTEHQPPDFEVLHYKTVTMEEMNQRVLAENKFDATSIYDILAAGRLDLVKWCRENARTKYPYSALYLFGGLSRILNASDVFLLCL